MAARPTTAASLAAASTFRTISSHDSHLLNDALHTLVVHFVDRFRRLVKRGCKLVLAYWLWYRTISIATRSCMCSTTNFAFLFCILFTGCDASCKKVVISFCPVCNLAFFLCNCWQQMFMSKFWYYKHGSVVNTSIVLLCCCFQFLNLFLCSFYARGQLLMPILFASSLHRAYDMISEYALIKSIWTISMSKITTNSFKLMCIALRLMVSMIIVYAMKKLSKIKCSVVRAVHLQFVNEFYFYK